MTIAAPIIMGNLGFILIGVGDVVIAGRYSTDAFAAISIATAIVNCILHLGLDLFRVFLLYCPIIVDKTNLLRNIFILLLDFQCCWH